MKIIARQIRTIIASMIQLQEKCGASGFVELRADIGFTSPGQRIHTYEFTGMKEGLMKLHQTLGNEPSHLHISVGKSLTSPTPLIRITSME